MPWHEVGKLVDTILAEEDLTKTMFEEMFEYAKLIKEGKPFYAWQRAIHLAAVACLKDLKEPKEHVYAEQRLRSLKEYESFIGFPKKEDLSELEAAIKKTWK